MGQYYKTCNIDKRELLHPHELGDGLKLMEFGMSSHGTLTGLAAMLTMNEKVKGPWAGDRIVITGDYADNGRFVPAEFSAMNLYGYAEGTEEDDEADDGDGEKANPSPGVPPFKRLKDELNAQILLLGIDGVTLGSRDDSTFTAIWEDKIYDQPEDVFEMLLAPVQENLRFVFSDMTRTLRCNNVDSSIAWRTPVEPTMKLDRVTGRCTEMSVRWADREGPGYVAATLHFPASAAEVRAFLGVKEADRLPAPKD